MAFIRSLFGNDATILRERDFQALLLANIISALGEALLSPILDSLIDPLGTSPENVGLLMSFFTAPAIVIIPIAGVLADRYGRKPVLIGALVLFGFGGLGITFTTEFRVVLGLRLLQGIAFGGLTPIIITSIGDRYDGSEEVTGQGIRFTSSGLSSAVFPFIAGVLVIVGWQYPFFLYALSFPAAVIVYVWFDEPTDAGGTATPAPDGGDGSSHLRTLLRFATRRPVLAMIIARGLPMSVWLGFLTYNSIVVVRVIGGTPAQAGLLTAVASLILAIAASQAGRITTMFDNLLYPLIGANVCLGVGFALFVFAPFLSIAGLGIATVGIGMGITLSIYRSIITSIATDSLRGGLVSLSEAFGRTIATVTPIFMGGAIAVAIPHLGIGPAVQVTGLAVAFVGSAGGVICLLLANPAFRDGTAE